MKKKLLIFNIIIFYFFLLKYIFSYIIFPFKTQRQQLIDEDKNISQLFMSLLDNNIFINLEIGEPNQTIKIFLLSDKNEFYLLQKLKNDTLNNNSNDNIYDINFDLNEFYDIEKSKSLIITNESIFSYPENIHLGNGSYDYIHLKTNENEKIKKKIPFILYFRQKRNDIPGAIGLNAILDESDKKYNFIDNLKKNDIINSYFWMIKYTSEFEGNLIIGEQPHIIDPLNYKEEELIISYPFLDDLMINWGLIFDNIILGEKNFRQYHDCHFKYEINYIKGHSEIENELDIYFNEFIHNGTCYKEKVNYTDNIYRFFYCNKEKYNENMKYFPKLKFYHYEFNYTFELNYKDLFIEKYDKLILMIFFDKFPFDIFLGKPFLKKYSFLINQDTNLLGYYIKKNKNNNIEKPNNVNFILKIILIIFGVVILLSLGVFIGKYYYKERKKNKNIIDEEYDYTSKNEEIN